MSSSDKKFSSIGLIEMFLLMLFFWAQPGVANAGITYSDIGAGGGAGLGYNRTRSPRDNQFLDFVGRTFTFEESMGLFYYQTGIAQPSKSNGTPGVAIFDYDRDGDLDIYVTNGPGTPNSLFSNQLVESGEVTFVDQAADAGVEATDQDSSGVSFGDIDNDDDQDLLVLGFGEANILYENNGDGTFTDITAAAGVGGEGDCSPFFPFAAVCTHTSASMGDINNDGLLDIYVSNTFDQRSYFPIFFEPFAINDHDQLYLNEGNNQFADVSATSGIQDLNGFPPQGEGMAGISWAVAMVDYDFDGDVDIFVADDQAAIPPAAMGGVDRGLQHLFKNDGTGHFTDVAVESGIAVPGSWMGYSFGDYNSDGFMDFFDTNFGDPAVSVFFNMPALGFASSKHFLGGPGGVFTDPGLGALVSTAFGWGTASFDYDNDGDTDILYHGGINGGPLIDASNPGLLLKNDGNANFTYDLATFAGSTNHLLRAVEGVAVGDLNEDGFVDIVTASSFDISPDSQTLFTVPFNFGGPLDGIPKFMPVNLPTGNPNEFVLNEEVLNLPLGTLAVELSSADNGNRWVKVRAKGTIGITSEGKANRDGIGAVMRFTPHQGKTVMAPILGGSSFQSQHDLTAYFGLGSKIRGTVDVLWPGGTKNRLYNVFHGSNILFPEIPCSYDTEENVIAYSLCVTNALDELEEADILSPAMKVKFLVSALVAYGEEH